MHWKDDNDGVAEEIQFPFLGPFLFTIPILFLSILYQGRNGISRRRHSTLVEVVAFHSSTISRIKYHIKRTHVKWTRPSIVPKIPHSLSPRRFMARLIPLHHHIVLCVRVVHPKWSSEMDLSGQGNAYLMDLTRRLLLLLLRFRSSVVVENIRPVPSPL